MTTRLLESEQILESGQMDEQLRAIFDNYAGEREDLIPILQDIQSVFGYLPRETLVETARFLRVSEAVVYGVATFYAQFNLTRQGKHRIKCCTGTACHVRGSKRVLDRVRKKVGIEPGETTPDYEFTLERIACLGSCALAPVVVIDKKVHGQMTPAKMDALLDAAQEKSPAADEAASN